MVINVEYFLLGILIHLVLFLVVIRLNFLTWPDGILVASLISFLSYLAGPLYWFMLFSFFIPSSLLSNYNKKKKQNLIISNKSSQRKGSQVLANSSGFLLFVLLQLMASSINGVVNLLFFLSGSSFIISAASDTWSTEIGTQSNKEPRFILNIRKKIPKGTSGGVTILGSFAGLLGAIYLSLLAYFSLFLVNIQLNIIYLFLIIVIGFTGTLIDSFLGATLQIKYYCPSCSLEVEDDYHKVCGKGHLKKTKKYTFLDNDTVNFISNMIVTLLTFFLFQIYYI